MVRLKTFDALNTHLPTGTLADDDDPRQRRRRSPATNTNGGLGKGASLFGFPSANALMNNAGGAGGGTSYSYCSSSVFSNVNGVQYQESKTARMGPGGVSYFIRSHCQGLIVSTT